MGPRELFTGTGIVREMSTRYVRFISVVSSFFLMVETLILLGFGAFGLDSGSVFLFVQLMIEIFEREQNGI